MQRNDQPFDEPVPTPGQNEPTQHPSEDPTQHPSGDPTEEQLAERRQRANRATRGGLAALLCLEAFVVLLVPRTIAQTSTGLSTRSSILLIAFALVLVATGFVLRRPWGIGLGSALQLVFALTIVLVPLMVIVVIIFASIWLYMLQTRHELVGTPDGWRMLIS